MILWVPANQNPLHFFLLLNVQQEHSDSCYGHIICNKISILISYWTILIFYVNISLFLRVDPNIVYCF